MQDLSLVPVSVQITSTWSLARRTSQVWNHTYSFIHACNVGVCISVCMISLNSKFWCNGFIFWSSNSTPLEYEHTYELGLLQGAQLPSVGCGFRTSGILLRYCLSWPHSQTLELRPYLPVANFCRTPVWCRCKLTKQNKEQGLISHGLDSTLRVLCAVFLFWKREIHFTLPDLNAYCQDIFLGFIRGLF